VTLYLETRNALRALGLRPRKRWGQHFLIDDFILRRLVRIAKIQSGDRVLEIGPGLGFSTMGLLDAGAEVWGIEIDPKLADWLRSRIQNPRFHLLVGDVLKGDILQILGKFQVKVVANLPYNISTQVLFKLLESSEVFTYIVLMLQREVAQRLSSSPSKKDYGSLSILTQIVADVREEFHVPRHAFFPRPDVDSSVVTLRPLSSPPIPPKETKRLQAWLTRLFSQRRKSLRNSFANAVRGLPALEILREARIDAGRRAETLSTDEVIRLHRLIGARDARAS
jgi:16S rRNA (adenine1518-N6/adenine1519-N6)-dimethyltransferase